MQVSFFSGLELVGSGGTCKYQWIGYLLIQYWRKEIILARFTFVLNLLRFFLFQSFLIEYIVVTQFITRTFYKINVLGNNTMLCTNHGGMLGMGGLKDACKATRRITRQLHIVTDHFPNSMLFDTRNLQLHQAFSGFPYPFLPSYESSLYVFCVLEPIFPYSDICSLQQYVCNVFHQNAKHEFLSTSTTTSRVAINKNVVMMFL